MIDQDYIDAQNIRRRSRARLIHTQGPLCPLCNKEPISDQHEIAYPKGVQSGGKMRLTGDFAALIYSFENTIELCHHCNVDIANSVPVQDMIELKMRQPKVDPLAVVQVMTKIASFTKNKRHWLPATVTYNQITYQIIP